MEHHTGTRNDFDFLFGPWHITHHKLRQRLAGCNEWDTYDGPFRCTPYLDGLANVDQGDIAALGVSGMSVRVFDPVPSQWSIYWISSTTGRLEPPVRGGFTGETGLFFGDDEHDGRPVEVRFTWTTQGPDNARWEQAFRPAGSDDAGWETNWIMEFTRTTA